MPPPIPATIAHDQVVNARALATSTSAPNTNTPAPATRTSVPPTSTQMPDAALTVTVLESSSASGSDITITYIRTSGFLLTSEQGVKVSETYTPHPERRRLPWYATDQLDFASLIPPEQSLVYQRRDQLLAQLHALPQEAESYGLVHGGFHHGNFLVDGEKITLFDFDAAEYFWYIGELCNSLYNCLPLPRTLTGRRRAYTLDYLRCFLRGYRRERPCKNFWLEQIPLFLRYCELCTYAYFHKYWVLSDLSHRRSALLADLRARIENEIPVVVFEPGDLGL